MGAVKSRLSNTIDTVLKKHSIRFSQAANTRASVLEAKARRQLGSDTRIQQFVSDIRDHVKANGGKLDGRFYQNIRSELGALESEKGIAPLARELREGLDSAFQQVAGKDAAKFQGALRQWRNMRIIEKAIDTEGGGNISAAKLANQFGTKANRSAGVYGQGDKSVVELARLAKAGKRLLTDKTPQSGTVPRGLMQAPVRAIATGTMMAPVQQMINRPAGVNYLTQGLFPQLPSVPTNALLRMQQGASIAAPAYLFSEAAQ